jgi:DNA-binding MarR family transcriptional regulator
MTRQERTIGRVPDAIAAADRLHSAAIHLLRRLRVRDQESGIGPAQFSALSVLVFAGPRSLKDLAAAEQVRPPTMSRVVAALIRQRLVRSTVEGDDKRRLRLEATDKGVAVMQAGRRRRVASLARALRRLPKDKVRQLAEAAELIDQLSREI